MSISFILNWKLNWCIEANFGDLYGYIFIYIEKQFKRSRDQAIHTGITLVILKVKVIISNIYVRGIEDVVCIA